MQQNRCHEAKLNPKILGSSLQPIPGFQEEHLRMMDATVSNWLLPKNMQEMPPEVFGSISYSNEISKKELSVQKHISRHHIQYSSHLLLAATGVSAKT